ncbi:hypothetical protein Tco_1304867 [Tanacetum coccineum]
MNASTSGNGTFSLINSFEALNVDNTVTEEVDSGDKAFMSGVQEEGQSSTPLVEKINMFEQHLLEGNCVLTDDEGKPLEKVEYLGDHGSEDKVEPVDNEMACFLALKLSGVGYGTNSLLEQRKETYGNADYDYDPYDDDMYEGQEIPDNIQPICDNLDIKVRGPKLRHNTEYDHTGPHDTKYDHTGPRDTEDEHTGQHDTNYDCMGQHDIKYDHTGQHDT